MDDRTEGVTLLNGFIFDVLQEFQHMRRACEPVFEMAKHLEGAPPDDWAPISLYNDICAWIETNIGTSTLHKAGVAIGHRAYDAIVQEGKLDKPTPLAMMEALKWAASTMIRDPHERGWEILSSTNRSITMRRTQTFNCILQEGLLQSLVEKAGYHAVEVEHAKCTRRDDEFCEYRITWVR